MKKLLAITLLISTSSCLSQNKLHLGVQVNGNFTTGIPSTSNWPSDYYKGIETFSFCYSAGATVEYDLTDKWSLQSGLLFRKSGDRSKAQFQDVTTNSGFIYPSDPTREGPYAYKFKYYGAELPLNVYFALTDKIKVGVGSSVVYIRKGNSQKHYNLTDNPESTPVFIFKKYNFLINLGLQYKVNEYFYFEAKTQYALTETFLAYFNTIDVPRNYLSLGFSVRYLFN